MTTTDGGPRAAAFGGPRGAAFGGPRGAAFGGPRAAAFGGPRAAAFGGPREAAAGALNAATRRRAIEALSAGELDVLVIGGGITGAGAALDAATRGLSVGLVEARDLAAGTSSASSKLIHGGLRYLEMGDIGLVREALRERELLLSRLAPHLVEPVPFLWPLHGRGWERVYLGAGLVLYDTLGGARSVPRHRHLGKRRALREAPALRGDALVGAVQFHDALEDDARMVAVVARTAAAHGAHVATRVRVTGFKAPGEVEAVDEETGEPLLLRARHIAAAVGAWTDGLRELAGGRSKWRNVHSKGIHIFVPRDRIPMESGVLARTEKSVLFVIPWQGGWLIGDTDTPWSGGPERPVATGADIDYLLAKTNALLAEPLRRDDVYGVTAGLRPLVAEAARSDTTKISRQHVVESPAPGLTTIAGGKYTTYRVMAADLIDAVAGALGFHASSVTRDVPLLGAGPRSTLPVDGPLARYGAAAGELAALIDARPDLAGPLEGASGHLRAEVVHACTHEGALHLEDVLERRTRLALTAPDRGLAAAEPAAALMAGVLGWSAERTRDEVEAYRARVAAARAGEAERDDDAALRAYRAALAERAPVAR
jgi:glycerol-3-phosphate dehydrogenase